jgi:hypothetical protein
VVVINARAIRMAALGFDLSDRESVITCRLT